MCGVRIDQTVTCWKYGSEDAVTEILAPPGRFLSVDTQRVYVDYEACGTRADRTVTCWAYKDGKLADVQEEVVPGKFLSVEMIDDESSNVTYRCGIRVDKTLACWGLSDVGPPSGQYLAPIHRDGIPTVVWQPSSDFLAAAEAGGETVSAGHWHSCGVRADLTIACWGSNHLLRNSHPGPTGQATPEFGRFLAVSSGSYHSCGLHLDLSIRCWGASEILTFQTFPPTTNRTRVTKGPSGTFLLVSAGDGHSCAVRVDQTVTCWGWWDHEDRGEVSAPAGQFLSVSAGGGHSCGVRVDQTVICWGSNQDRHGKHIGQAEAPAGRFVSVTTGHRHSCALGTDGAVTCWGDNTSGWPIDEDECTAWTGDDILGLPFGRCDQLSRAQRPPGQSDPPPGRFLVPSLNP